MAKGSHLVEDPRIATKEYTQTLSYLKKQVIASQTKAILSANVELIKLYWIIGKTIVEKQKESSWGTGVIEKLAKDLQKAFPKMKGFSRANIFFMRAFYLAYQKVQQPARQLKELPIFHIPWWHNVILITKIKNAEQRLWYAQKAIDNGWSRSLLETAIQTNLFSREGKAITNFKKTLPTPHSSSAQQALKDPYLFDFVTLSDDHHEREVEQGLVDNVQKTLLELGKGFSFVSRQQHIEVGNKIYILDLLFYHYKLKCFIVVELKAREFKPSDAGQINFYLSAVDDLLRSTDDKPTIGLILCKSKDNLTAEYALRDINKPIGVAEYGIEILEKLPKGLRASLPTVEELEAELEKHEILASDAKKQDN